MCSAFRRTALAVESAAPSVPETVVHGDVWARNAVEPPGGGSATLIEWETSGLGLGILDLGSCLMECHLNSAASSLDPDAWLIAPDEDRIAATASGYASARTLSAGELTLLPDAIKFGTAVAGALHVDLALTQGVSGPTMDARLARLEDRLAIADEVAELAMPYLS